MNSSDKAGCHYLAFYNKMANDSFKPLERELLEKLFNDKQFINRIMEKNFLTAQEANKKAKDY